MSKFCSFLKGLAAAFDPSSGISNDQQATSSVPGASPASESANDSKKSQPKAMAEGNHFLGSNNVEAYRNVLDALAMQLRPIDPGSVVQMKLLLLVPSTNDFMVLHNPKFLEQAQRELALQGFHLREICVRNESCPEGKNLKLVGNTFYWMMEAVEAQKKEKPAPTVRFAEISILDGMGELLEDRYVLENVEGRVYRIGRGEKKGLEGNDIAFNPDPQGACYEINKYVRSKHAHIDVIGGRFFLSPYISGTPADGSRTQIIIPNNDKKELDTSATRIELHSGDCICLSKKAKLQVNIIYNNN